MKGSRGSSSKTITLLCSRLDALALTWRAPTYQEAPGEVLTLPPPFAVVGLVAAAHWAGNSSQSVGADRGHLRDRPRLCSKGFPDGLTKSGV
jgi:hypothetical protein